MKYVDEDAADAAWEANKDRMVACARCRQLFLPEYTPDHASGTLCQGCEEEEVADDSLPPCMIGVG
jgi:formylmethanofuran dehydrogenase subunit E